MHLFLTSIGEDNTFDEESKDFQLSKTSARSYRPRDKGSYGDSYQGDIDSHRQRHTLPPSQTEERKHREHRHGDHPSSRRQEGGATRHHRSREHKTKHRRGEVISYSRGDNRHSRSRSPTYSHLDKFSERTRPPLSSRVSDPSGDRRGAWSHHRQTKLHPHKIKPSTNSDSDTERRRHHVVDRLVKDLESSNSSSSSDTEGELKEATPILLKSVGGEEVKEPVVPKISWKDITFEDSEEEKEKEKEEEEEEEMIDILSEEEDVQSNEDIKEDEVSVSPPPPEVEEEEVAMAMPEPEEEMPLPEATPPREEVLYLPALMGCRSVECYHWLNRIEEGTYGVVYRAKDIRTGKSIKVSNTHLHCIFTLGLIGVGYMSRLLVSTFWLETLDRNLPPDNKSYSLLKR